MTHRSTLYRLRTWVVVAAAAALASPPAIAAAERENTWDRFRVLAERNLFVRDRRPRLPQSQGPIRHVPAPPAAPRFVLTGIARRREAFVAFFENTATGETVRARTGETLGGGVIHAISMNGVDYVADGEATRIAIGDTLTGEPPPPAEITDATHEDTATEDASQEETPPDPDETPAPEAAPETPTDLADILERMRQRREQELKK